MFKIQKQHTRLQLREHPFSIRIVNLWNSLPEDVVCANTMTEFKNGIDNALLQSHNKFSYTIGLCWKTQIKSCTWPQIDVCSVIRRKKVGSNKVTRPSRSPRCPGDFKLNSFWDLVLFGNLSQLVFFDGKNHQWRTSKIATLCGLILDSWHIYDW